MNLETIVVGLVLFLGFVMLQNWHRKNKKENEDAKEYLLASEVVFGKLKALKSLGYVCDGFGIHGLCVNVPVKYLPEVTFELNSGSDLNIRKKLIIDIDHSAIKIFTYIEDKLDHSDLFEYDFHTKDKLDNLAKYLMDDYRKHKKSTYFKVGGEDGTL